EGGGGTDGASGEAGADASGEGGVPNPCEAGTCRFSSNPSGACLPPGGPIGTLDGGTLSGCCGCGSDGFCSSECECASPDTPIATPAGDRPIASLVAGDVVLSVDHGVVAAVPILATRRRPVSHHLVIEVALRDGTVLRVSAAHPTADGRSFGDLRAGDWLGGREVASAAVVPYDHDATYDILPDSDTGTYFAGGALIGSTLAPSRPSRGAPLEACTLPAAAAFPR
ncbi:MAG: Hint domain-containing protein, partial [Polyangiaceae bacterium]